MLSKHNCVSSHIAISLSFRKGEKPNQRNSHGRRDLMWVYKNVDFSQPRDISKKLEINSNVNGFMQNKRKKPTITEDILLFTEVSLPGHANPCGIYQHIACKSFIRIRNNCHFSGSLHEHILFISQYSKCIKTYDFQKSL